jgi:hypothetical protein
VFLAERTDTLEIFAETLSRRGHHTNFVVGKQTKGEWMFPSFWALKL